MIATASHWIKVQISWCIWNIGKPKAPSFRLFCPYTQKSIIGDLFLWHELSIQMFLNANAVCSPNPQSPYVVTTALHRFPRGTCASAALAPAGKPWTRVLVIRGKRPLEGRVQQLPGFNLPSELNCVCARAISSPKADRKDWSGAGRLWSRRHECGALAGAGDVVRFWRDTGQGAVAGRAAAGRAGRRHRQRFQRPSFAGDHLCSSPVLSWIVSTWKGPLSCTFLTILR